jgi:hypothetical protein
MKAGCGTRLQTYSKQSCQHAATETRSTLTRIYDGSLPRNEGFNAAEHRRCGAPGAAVATTDRSCAPPEVVGPSFTPTFRVSHHTLREKRSRDRPMVQEVPSPKDVCCCQVLKTDKGAIKGSRRCEVGLGRRGQAPACMRLSCGDPTRNLMKRRLTHDDAWG